MEQKLKNAFDALAMPESCSMRIENKLCKPQNRGYYAEPVRQAKFGWVKGAAAAAALVCLVTIGMLLHTDSALSAVEPPEETETTGDGRSEILDQNGDVLVGIQDDSGDYEGIHGETIREKAPDFDTYFIMDEDGRVFSRSEDAAAAHAASAPYWIRDEEGRLYFTGNEEKIDITGEISLETPFIYIYTDSNQAVWALVAGRTTTGPYVDIGNSVGWFTFCWDASLKCWVRDGGTHWSNWMDCEWPWLTQAQKMLEYEYQLDKLKEELEDLQDTVEDTRNAQLEDCHDNHCH